MNMVVKSGICSAEKVMKDQTLSEMSKHQLTFLLQFEYVY